MSDVLTPVITLSMIMAVALVTYPKKIKCPHRIRITARHIGLPCAVDASTFTLPSIKLSISVHDDICPFAVDASTENNQGCVVVRGNGNIALRHLNV